MLRAWPEIGLNLIMTKSQKELAFLHDLYLQDDWTRRFTDLVDKHMDLRDSDNMLYINAGTGGHALAVGVRFGESTDIFASCENEDLLTIARDKAAAVSSPVDFSAIRFEDDAFDSVLTDASLLIDSDFESAIHNTVRVARTGGDVAVMLPTAGSFGEIFSLLWEALLNGDLPEHGGIVETLIAGLPTVSAIEAIAERTGWVNINTQTAIEGFDYETSAEFVSSPLVSDFLFPRWLQGLDDDERERAVKELAALIDVADDTLTFRFSVKATLLTGEKE